MTIICGDNRRLSIFVIDIVYYIYILFKIIMTAKAGGYNVYIQRFRVSHQQGS